MAERKIPNIPHYKGNDQHLSDILDKLKLAIDHIINTDFVTENDLYCRDLITSTASIYIGEKSAKNKLDIVEGRLRFAQDNLYTDKDVLVVIKKQTEKIERLENKISALEKEVKNDKLG